MQSILGLFKLRLTPEVIEQLGNYQPGIVFSGYEPFVPITESKLPDEITAKLMAGNPRLIITAQLVGVTKEDLQERYGLTPEEADLVDESFSWIDWRLRRSPSPDSD